MNKSTSLLPKLFKALLLSFLMMTAIMVNAQKITAADRNELRKKEDSLKELSIKIVTGINPADRLKADSIFTRVFVRALKINHSFNYAFDSLNISKLISPDTSFRIFTWQMFINDNVIRQHGAIQMRTADGSLKLFGLIDKSDVTENTRDSVGNQNGWMGAVYYKIILKEPGTTVRRNGIPLTITGNVYKFSSSSADYIEADKPIMVAQFMSGTGTCNGGQGDPEMIYLSP
ncbi:MAG: hypothetical protein EOO20_28420, partial [Chryseobacterium sp.]